MGKVPEGSPPAAVDLVVEVFKSVAAPIAPAFLRRALLACCSLPEVRARLPFAAVDSPAGLAMSVRLAGDRELRRLNREFLGEDRPTDVLSFPFVGAGEWDGPAGVKSPPPDAGGGGKSGRRTYLGDLAISWPTAVRQAAAFGHPPEAEVALLAVHGLLHLLGWDHAGRDGEREMTRLSLLALSSVRVRLAPARLASSS